MHLLDALRIFDGYRVALTRDVRPNGVPVFRDYVTPRELVARLLSETQLEALQEGCQCADPECALNR
jgi:hypothetical protein